MTIQPDGFSTDDTLGSLVDEVITSLQGYGLILDQVCSLVGNITADQTQITLDSGDMLSRGVIEIDHELMYVTRCSNGVATVPSWGRGYKGTGKRAHDNGRKRTVFDGRFGVAQHERQRDRRQHVYHRKPVSEYGGQSDFG